MRRYGLVDEDEAGEGPEGRCALPPNSAQTDEAVEDMEVVQAEVTSYSLFRYMRAPLDAAYQCKSVSTYDVTPRLHTYLRLSVEQICLHWTGF